MANMSNERPTDHSYGRLLFSHSPLNQRENSIRLIRLLSDLSPDGLVRCSIHHAKLSPGAADGATVINKLPRMNNEWATSDPIPYACLSYTWGGSANDTAVLIDGKILRVRKNLEMFLHVARTRLDYCYLWIDAICIDQASPAERDHQVQQMGTIFSKAKMLITWLGCARELEQLLGHLGPEHLETRWDACKRFYEREHHQTSVQSYVSFTSEIYTALPISTYLTQTDMLALYAKLVGHAYWRRAWVTQEIMLAKAIYVVAGHGVLDYPNLVQATRDFAHVHSESHFEQFVRLMLVQRDYFARKDVVTGRVLISDSWINNWGLVNILHHFEDRHCTVRRDMVYSVLSLSREAEQLKVNYQSPTSELLWQILNICKDSLCLCTIEVLVRALDKESFVSTEPRMQLRSPFVDVPMCGFQAEDMVSIARCPFCGSPVDIAESSRIGLIFCLLTACKDSDSHLYQEYVGCHYQWFVVSPRRNERKSLGEIGRDIGVTSDANSNNQYLLRLSLPALLKIVSGLQWGHTLKMQCGNLWPHKDRPNLPRLSIRPA